MKLFTEQGAKLKFDDLRGKQDKFFEEIFNLSKNNGSQKVGNENPYNN